LVASLSDILGRYVLAAGVIMALGSEALVGEGAERRRKRWGGVGLWVLGIMCIGELGVKYLWDLRISGGDTLHVNLLSLSSGKWDILMCSCHIIFTSFELLYSSFFRSFIHSFHPDHHR